MFLHAPHLYLTFLRHFEYTSRSISQKQCLAHLRPAVQLALVRRGAKIASEEDIIQERGGDDGRARAIIQRDGE
jgi:hypothetical protein